MNNATALAIIASLVMLLLAGIVACQAAQCQYMDQVYASGHFPASQLDSYKRACWKTNE